MSDIGYSILDFLVANGLGISTNAIPAIRATR